MEHRIGAWGVDHSEQSLAGHAPEPKIKSKALDRASGGELNRASNGVLSEAPDGVLWGPPYKAIYKALDESTDKSAR